jgi:hypothetical protein
MLCTEFRKYSLDRGWYFYPDALPRDAIAKDDIRNGHIDRKLAFPLEDLYGDGQPAGKVGQEIYSCGGAFVFAARGIHFPSGAPFSIFTDYPCVIAPSEDGGLIVKLQGPAGFAGRLRLVRTARHIMPRIVVRSGASSVPASRRDKDYRDYRTPADASVSITWS